MCRTTGASLPAPDQLRAEFAYAGGRICRGGQVTLYVDGAPAGGGEVKRTHPLYFASPDGALRGRGRRLAI
jgi:hypothetical protein